MDQLAGAAAGAVARLCAKLLGGGLAIRFVLVPLLAVALASVALAARLGLAAGWQAAALAALLALGVALLVGRRVRRQVTEPLAELRAAARRMAEGRLDAPVRVSGVRELAELGQALARMAEGLGERIEYLESERAKVAAILDGMVEGVVALDARQRVLLVNPAARAMLGLTSEPVDGRPFLEVVRHKELFDLVEGLRVGPEGAHARRELELGPLVSRLVAAHAVSVAFAPKSRGIVLVLHDVTALRRLERVKTEFVANVSHELRTPLTCIRGYLETLLDGALEEPANARRFLEVANTHADRLSRLVDDLLQLSNIETGKLTLLPQALDLREVAGGVLDIFERPAARQRLTLVNDVPPGLRVHADRDRLAQVLVNLVDNAVKFTPDEGRVTLGAAPAADGLVEVRVGDTGIGIPSTDLPRITERFYRVDKTRSRELGGTGLGLAIVKHLVQAHGGELSIDSTLGQGTTVSFTLPAA